MAHSDYLKTLADLVVRVVQVFVKARTPVRVSQPETHTLSDDLAPVPAQHSAPSSEPPKSRDGFLICPIQANDEQGRPVMFRTVKICSVVDHSGTALDPGSGKRWGLGAKDQKVRAFNGEVGGGFPSSSAPFGYTKQQPAPFFVNKEINYVGSPSLGDAYGPTFYLNYDGHAGYDFLYPRMTPVIAPADGELKKATAAEDTVYGQGWDAGHTFYIKHTNGFSTWYRHCVKLVDEIESAIGNDFSKSRTVQQGKTIAYVGAFGTGGPHLHFEVRDPEGNIVDPYEDDLWIMD